MSMEIFLQTSADELESLGAKAELARSGAEALEKIIQRHGSGTDYSIVILDKKIPDMDCIEAADDNGDECPDNK